MPPDFSQNRRTQLKVVGSPKSRRSHWGLFSTEPLDQRVSMLPSLAFSWVKLLVSLADEAAVALRARLGLVASLARVAAELVISSAWV